MDMASGQAITSEITVSEVRFIADCMLGKLSRWLRICGFDTLYYRQIRDHDLLVAAEKEKRVLLTRDHALFKLSRKKNLRAVMIAHDFYEDQLKQVFQELDIQAPPLALGRCLNCNELLRKIDKAEIEHTVPAYVFNTERTFYICPSCRKVYWRGTHWEQMRRSLERLLGGCCSGTKGESGGRK